MRRLLLLSWGLVLLACAPPPQPDPTMAQRRAAQEACGRERAEVLALFDQVERSLSSSATSAPMTQRVMDARTRYEAVSAARCEAPDAGEVRVGASRWSVACLEEVPTALGELLGVIASAELDAESAAWVGWSKVHWLEGAMRCDVTDAGGSPVTVSVAALCERLEGDHFVAEPACAGAELVEGDRLMLRITADGPAWVYVLNGNTTGQFQLLYPAPGEDNLLPVGQEVVVPEAETWWVLDDVSGVTEHIQVVAASEPLELLESLRGREQPPGGRSSLAEARVRGWLEPVTTRVHRQVGQPIRVSAGDHEVETIPMMARRAAPSVLEFGIRHGRRRAPVESAWVAAVRAARPSGWWRLGDATQEVVQAEGGLGEPLRWVGARAPQPSAVAGEADGAVGLLDGAHAVGAGGGVWGGSALSVALWLRTRATNEATPLSYATAHEANAFVLHDPANLRVYVNGGHVRTGVRLNDGAWHHLAVTWRASDGQLLVYRDGELVFTGRVSAGQSLEPGGSLVIGQEQDCLAGCFEPRQAFEGALDELVVFSEVMEAEGIAALARGR